MRLGSNVRALLAAATIGLACLGSAVTPILAIDSVPTPVSTAKTGEGKYAYLVNGQPQLLVGMGYNPTYGHLSFADRAASYLRDFRTLCQAGVNTITGWDSDKGYMQDTFDQLTLDSAYQHGLGVVMPFFLPKDGDYLDPQFTNQLMASAAAKIARYKDHPAIRMWGVGNEVLNDMPPAMDAAFVHFYLGLADLFHASDPNHPVIYREAEDRWVPLIAQALQDSGDMRPWLLYGMNIYDKDPAPLLQQWPSYGLDRPLFISEFGWEGASPADRAAGYASMWRSIRSFPDYVLGAAPYAWSIAGPEPTDEKWGLMNASGQPVDGTFDALQQLWRAEPGVKHGSCG
jgi:beta-galactosidase/beta-glucuronidase